MFMSFRSSHWNELLTVTNLFDLLLLQVNVQNVVVNIRHGRQSSSSSSSSQHSNKDEVRPIKRSKSNSETVAHHSLSQSSLSTSSSGQDFRSKFLEEFQDVEMLGAGGFGVVFKATHKIDCRDYAVKRIQLPSK